MPVLELLQALGAVATAASLIYLARQTGAARTEADLAIRVSLLNAHDALTDRAMSINAIFIERPDLRPFFYGNVELPQDLSDDSTQRVTAVAEHVADFIENALLHQSTLGSSAGEIWENYCVALVSQSPILRAFLTENINWYNADVRRILDRGTASHD